MQMLKKIFNSDSKYYLELDETEESKPVKVAVKTAQKTAQKAVETAEKALDSAEDKLESTTTKEAQAKTKSQAPSNKSKKASSKVAVEGEKQPAKKAKPAPKNAGASSYEPPFWVAAMYNKGTNTNDSNGSQAEQTFATDNLMPTITKYRRTPGPSLKKFRDMANKAKTPKG